MVPYAQVVAVHGVFRLVSDAQALWNADRPRGEAVSQKPLRRAAPRYASINQDQLPVIAWRHNTIVSRVASR